jgi:hypothetical protein
MGLLLGAAITVWLLVTLGLLAGYFEMDSRVARLEVETDDTLQTIQEKLKENDEHLWQHDQFIGRSDTWDSKLEDFRKLVAENTKVPEWLTKGLKEEPSQTTRRRKRKYRRKDS